MPTRDSSAAGVVTFGQSADPTWVATDLSGDWGDAANWSPMGVPGSADAVTISGSAAVAWTVTATNEAAASLTLAMTSGTLAATGALSVVGTLTQQAGLLLAEPGATITIGALVQTGGTVAIGNSAAGGATLDSHGTDSIDGQATLLHGATWDDQALVLGADSGGTGSLEIDDGSAASVGGLTVLDGSSISVDALSGIAVGSAAAEMAGAISVGTGAQLLADIATLAADLDNAGTFAIVPVNGGTEAGSVLITGSLYDTGLVTIDSAATLAIAGGVEADAGSMVVGAGALLEAGSTASLGIYLAGGSLELDGGTLDSLGTGDDANSNALLDDGTWTTATLSIAPGYLSGPAAVAGVTLLDRSLLSSGTGIDIGNDPGAGGSAGAGGVGSLDLMGGSTVQAGAMAVLNGSTLALDETSTVMLGAASAEWGAVAIGEGGLLAGDLGTIAASVADDGTLIVADLSLEAASDIRVTGSLTGTGTVEIVAGGTLEVDDAGGFAGRVSIGNGGELILDAGDMSGAEITSSGGTISVDVEGQSFDPYGNIDPNGFVPTYDAATGLLVFGDAAQQSTLEFAPGLALTDFSLYADAAGTGTQIVQTPCFAAGTRIGTARGEAPVEALRPGDVVRLAGGGTAPVVWLGHRRVGCRQHPRPADVQPVRIAAHAFGLGRPRRELLVSPDHAVFVDGVLIPVRYLLNDATVRQQDVGFVTYWHVELPAHGVLLAEGLPCESFLDTGNRAAFANGGGVVMAQPDFAGEVWQRQGCAPLVTDGPARDRVYRRLLAQAFLLGWRLAEAAGGSEWVRPSARATGSAARRAAR